ncbi:MAG TPA: hypothetical protein DD417_19975 [Elusimicrobia bacterium]|nr:hypothetical protein [Elusimicrobiota bacterium]
MTPDQAVLRVPHPEFLLERIAGLSVLERQLFVLRRAGIRRVWITAPRPGDPRLGGLRWPEGLELVWGAQEADGAPSAQGATARPGDGGPLAAACAPPYVAVSGGHFIRKDTLEALLSVPHDLPTFYQDWKSQGIVQFFPAGQALGVQMEFRPLPRGATFTLEAPLRDGRVLRWVLDQARKETDGFMARHFDRNISLAVTRLLLDTPVRPTHMTVFSSLVGVAGGFLMLGGTYPFVTAGAAAVWLHSVLDGCDGELARLRFQESRLGGLIDFWGDNGVHFCLFLCLGLGRARVTGNWVPALLGVLAAGSAAVSAWLAAPEWAPSPAPGGPLFRGVADTGGAGSLGLLARVENTLAQRDFIYLLLFLAVVGWIDVFVVAAGVGSPLFLAVLLLLRSRRP